MFFLRSLVLLIFSLCSIYATVVAATDSPHNYKSWLESFLPQARAAGISQRTLTAAFADFNAPLPRVIELDRNQPEFTQPLEVYVRERVGKGRVNNGRRMLKRYPTWLGRIEKGYGVPRQVIVALWGIETNYGAHSGSFPVIQSLATLAHDGRRSDYFRKELLDALHILDAGHIRLGRMKGSWAGAMGQCQFMPSSFRNYGVDADGDGRINIWGSVPDVLASASNYLKKVGWKSDQPWGYPVVLTKNIDPGLVGLSSKSSLSDWQSLGVQMANGDDLPPADLSASLILPEGPNGPAYLVYDNYRVLLRWNNSPAFAIAVGTLADRLTL
jgi:membrane-bound lytic murein transglycosylase B